MSSVSAHPERLHLALDEALDHEVRLILYVAKRYLAGL